MRIRERRTLVMALLLAIIAALTLAACGGDDDGGNGGGASSDELANFEPGDQMVRGVDENTFPKPKPAGDYTIGVTFPHFKDEYWVAEAWGVQQEADELGIDVEIQAAGGYGDTAGQLDQLETFRTQGVDALIVGAVDSEGIAPTIDQAWADGIPVIYANALAESEKVMGVFTDDELAGTAQADFIASQDPNAKVIAMCGPPGVIWPKLRCEAFVRQLQAKAPNAEVLTERYHDMDRAVIADLASSTLQGQPDATWVYNSTDLQAKGVVDAIRARGGQPGDIGITNLTTGRELWGMLEDGWINFALAERPVLQGRLAVDQAVMVLNGEKPEARWAVALPGYTNSPADIQKFMQVDEQFNWSPEDYSP
jgi:protein TorT